MEDVLMSSEIEFYVQTMQEQELKELGSQRWMEWHVRLQKLNQQAVVEASAVKEEQVKETIVSFKKIAVLVHEAIVVSIWKQKVFPLLLKLCPKPTTTFIAYGVLYHEAIAVSLLELILYHESTCESLSDNAIDLLDYAYDAVTQLLVLDIKTEVSSEHCRDEKELLRQKDTIAFDLGIRCISIIRYMCEYMDKISLSLITRIYSQHDIPLLFVQMLQEKPWLKSGKMFLNGKWITADFELITKTEAQVWLILRHLLLDNNCTTSYEITEFKRNQFLKLIPLLTPTILDQLSPLVELLRWLHQLQASSVQSTPKSRLLMEVLNSIKLDIIQRYDGKWKKVARHQLGVIFSEDKEFILEAAQKFNAAFNTDLLEKFENLQMNNDNSQYMEETCTKCGNPAIQRCSKCKNAWYCSRRCQVDDWREHKLKCN